MFLEISQNSQKSTCARVSFSIKLQAWGLRPVTLLKKGRWHRCFLVNFAKFLGTPFTWNTSGRDAWTYWTSAYGHCLFKKTTSNLFNQRPFFSVKSNFSWPYFPRTYYSNKFHPPVFSIVLFLRGTKSNFHCWFKVY